MAFDAQAAQRVFAASDLLYDEHQVAAAIARMATAISRDWADRDPLFLCVMNGGLIPAGLLLPHLLFPMKIDYLHASRYRERTFGDELHWKKRPEMALAGRHVILMDDILDEGHTLAAITAYCESEGAATVTSAVLVAKQHQRGLDITADYVGLEVPDRYVFGVGMDYKGYWRNAPGIYAAPHGHEGLA